MAKGGVILDHTNNFFDKGQMLFGKHRSSLPWVRSDSRRHPARSRKTPVAPRHATSKQPSTSSPVHWTLQLLPQPHQGLCPHLAATASTDQENCQFPTRLHSGRHSQSLSPNPERSHLGACRCLPPGRSKICTHFGASTTLRKSRRML